jgi:glucose-6-phosphate isomerase
MINFDFKTYTKKFIDVEELKQKEDTQSIIKSVFNGKNDMMGWYDLDNLFNKELIDDIESTASYIRGNCDVFLILGIGGPYQGSLATIEALNPYYYNSIKKPQIYFAGTSLSSDYYNDLGKIIEGKDIIVNVISKSGTTLETNLAYSWIKNIMNNK